MSKTRVELIVRALKERLRSRVALQKQLDALVKVRIQMGLNQLPIFAWLFMKFLQVGSTESAG